MSEELKKGDYVLATKYSDGDPGDHFVVGFYDRQMEQYKAPDIRHMIHDGEGKQFRANGFRRVAKISSERGRFIVNNMKEIEQSHHGVWFFSRCRLDLFDQKP
jgi:hypothetical protein